MQRFVIGVIGVALAAGLVGTSISAADEALTLWYRQPAQRWDHGMPIGNGRLGAMVFGETASEHLELNESTLVSGYPGYRTLALDVRKNYDEVTRLIATRQFAEARLLVANTWLGASQAVYQPLGDLFVDFNHAAEVSDYRRELDLGRAIVRVSYLCDGVRYTREIFASHADAVIAMRLMCDKPGKLAFVARLTSPHKTAEIAAQEGKIALHGQVPGFVISRRLDWVEKKHDTWKYPDAWDKDGKRKPGAAQYMYNGRGVLFDARLAVEVRGGTLTAGNRKLTVAGADEAVLRLTAASSYNGFDKDPVREGVDSAKAAETALAAAVSKPFDALREAHTRDYAALFNRVALDLGPSPTGEPQPTDVRLDRVKARGEDPALEVLYFQFGRYLMISGTRPGDQPLALQGIWNKSVLAPWAGQYTININTEMNYWAAEPCNLAECTEPLLRMIAELAVEGARVAHDMYGCHGWVAHHNTTLWRCAQPVDNSPTASYWPMGGAWLCRHLVDRYEFSGDREFLKTAYPLLKGACEFYLDWMVPDASGRLVTPVSTSPENGFAYVDATGKKLSSSVCTGTAMDMAIIRQLLGDTRRAAEILAVDEEFRTRLSTVLSKLRPYMVGSKGQILEWQEEFEERDLHHRHTSHLFGLYPGTQITPRGTPDLAAAARRSLEVRGDGGGGWSKAWKINFWARLGDGDHAHTMIHALLAESTLPSMLNGPTFQVDGNFGGTSGIAEMLVQSHADEIELLPALPKAWPRGSVRGLKARGKLTVDLAWNDGKVTSYRIVSDAPRAVKVRIGGAVQTVEAAVEKRS
jgi:alpha-L-fucosidase 2